MEEIQDLGKRIDFNNITYHYKGKIVPKNFIGFKGPLSFYRSIEEGYITLEDQKSTKKYDESREKVIELFDDYPRIVSEAKYRTKYGQGLKISTPKQMLQRLPIALAQVKAGNTSENLVNETRQII